MTSWFRRPLNLGAVTLTVITPFPSYPPCPCFYFIISRDQWCFCRLIDHPKLVRVFLPQLESILEAPTIFPSDARILPYLHTYLGLPAHCIHLFPNHVSILSSSSDGMAPFSMGSHHAFVVYGIPTSLFSTRFFFRSSAHPITSWPISSTLYLASS